MMLAFLALSGLLAKRRWCERPKRSGKVFTLDAGRLLVAGTTCHVLNVLISIYLTDSDFEDECKFYLVNYLLDVVIGVPLSYSFLFLTTLLAERNQWTSITRRGYYGGDNVSLRQSFPVWAKQTLELTCVLGISKIIIVIPLFLFRRNFDAIGETLVSPVQGHPHFELFFVMLVVPMTFNALQFLIFDFILKDDLGSNNGPTESNKLMLPDEVRANGLMI